MCLDEYTVATIVRERIAEAQAAADRQRLLAQFRTPLKVALGRALIRLGRRLAAGGPGRVQPSTT